jgi:hypothetical protein
MCSMQSGRPDLAQIGHSTSEFLFQAPTVRFSNLSANLAGSSWSTSGMAKYDTGYPTDIPDAAIPFAIIQN